MTRKMTNYERAAYQFAPALRARVSRVMHAEMGMSQQEIADVFGTTQASVSKYLNGKHGREINNIGDALPVTKVHKIAANMAARHRHAAQKHTCNLCQAYNKFNCDFMVK